MKRLRDFMTPASHARYLVWRATRSRKPFKVELRSGERFFMRPDPATDIGTAYEVFVSEVYAPPAGVSLRDVKRVVDVGANVGYSVLYWMRLFPTARIDAFEPHPRHVRLIYDNVALNAHPERVTLHAAAASTRAGSGSLVDDESRSTMAAAVAGRRVPISVVDFFAQLGDEPIDLLKMDIEGAEYPLLEDKRFERIGARAMVLEWHPQPDRPRAQEWCMQRLRECGFDSVMPVPDPFGRTDVGVLWATRSS